MGPISDTRRGAEHHTKLVPPAELSRSGKTAVVGVPQVGIPLLGNQRQQIHQLFPPVAAHTPR